MPDWLVGFLDGVSAWQAIVWASAVIAAVVWLAKKKPWTGVVAFAKAIVQGAEILDAVKDLPTFIEKTSHQLDSIYHETHFNNGSSIKDAVVRTERVVNDLKSHSEVQTGTLATVQQQIQDLHIADAALRQEFESTLNKEGQT